MRANEYLILLTGLVIVCGWVGLFFVVRSRLRHRRAVQRIRTEGVRMSDDIDDVSAALPRDEAIRQVRALLEDE